jgi:ATP-dependent Lon protease
MFAVAPPDPQSGAKGSPYKVAGIGLIRACVDQPDGTSNLVLEGFSRIRVKRFIQDEPFYIGEIEPLVTDNSEPLESDALALKLLEIMGKMHQSGEIQAKGLMQFLTDIKDHETLADIISYSFIEDSLNKQLLLETLSLRERLHRLVKILLAQSEEAPPLN